MKKLSKILIPVLLLALIFTLVTVVAFAEGEEAQIGETKYATLAEALANAKAGDTVTLLKDVTPDASKGNYFTVDKQLTVDLAGHKITWNANDGEGKGADGKLDPDMNPCLFIAKDGADLTITSSAATKGAFAMSMCDRLVSVDAANTASVKLTLNNLTIGQSASNGDIGTLSISNAADITVTGVDWTHVTIKETDVTRHSYGSFLYINPTKNADNTQKAISVTVENSQLVGALNCIFARTGANVNATFKNSTITADSPRLEADNKQGRAIAIDMQSAGTSNSVYNFENCLISSGYRTFALANNTADVQINFKDSELRGGPHLDGAQSQNSLIMRGCPTVTFEGKCKIWVYPNDPSKSWWTSGGTSNITIPEGTLCNALLSGGTSKLVTPEGMSWVKNTDPETNADWPYVIGKGAPVANVVIEKDYTGQTIDTDDGGKITGSGTANHPSSGIKQGHLEVAQNADGNYYYRYASDGISRVAKDQNMDAFSGITPNGGKFVFADNNYFVVDLDFMTDSQWFRTYCQVDPRGVNPDTQKVGFAWGKDNTKPDIYPNDDGTATLRWDHKDGTGLTNSTPVTLQPNTWYHWTIAFKVDKTNTENSVLVFFLNGKYFGHTNQMVAAHATYIDSIARWGVASAKKSTTGVGMQDPNAMPEGYSLCYDNIRMVTYNVAFDEIENTVFNLENPTLNGYSDAVWSSEYQFPNPKIYAALNSNGASSYYGSFDAALAAAKDGDTLTLYTDVEGEYAVNAAITIVKNGYKASVSNFYSSAADASGKVYNIAETETELTFALCESAIEVWWNYGGTEGLELADIEYYGVGNTPAYKGNNLVLAKMVDGKPYIFTGWANYDDGTPIKQLAAADTLVIYNPVYEEVRNALYGIKEGENWIAFGADPAAVKQALQDMQDGQTMQLLADVTVEGEVVLNSNKTLTLDLNTHSWTTTYDPKIEKDGGKVSSFSVSNNATLTIQNGSVFNKNTAMNGTKPWHNGGAVAYITTATVYMKDVNTYAAVAGALNKGAKMYVDGGEHYRCVADWSALFICYSGNCVVDVQNATLSGGINGGSTPIIDCRENGTNTYTVSFTNCQIGGAGNIGTLFAQLHDAKVTFTECNIFEKIAANKDAAENYTITLAGMCTVSWPAISLELTYPEDMKLLSANIEGDMTYNYCVYGLEVVDGKYVPNYTVNEYTVKKAVALVLAPASTPTATVIFKNGETVLATEEYAVLGEGMIAKVVYTGAAPVGTPTNGFYGYEFAGFDGVTEITAVGTYEKQAQFAIKADVTGMKYNLSLYSDYVINLYVPKDAKVTALQNAKDGENLLGATVTIGGKEYYVVRIGADVNMVGSDMMLYVTVSDGTNTATQEVALCVMKYAEAILKSADMTDADKTLMMAMLDYADEAYALLHNNEHSAPLTAILTNEAYAAYIPEAKTVSGTAQDMSGLAEYIVSAQLNLDAQPDFLFTLKAGTTYTVTASYKNAAGETVTVDAKDGVISVNNMRMYEYANDITLTVKNGEETVATGTYNLATYLAGADVNADFAAAIATYVETCKAYKNA